MGCGGSKPGDVQASEPTGGAVPQSTTAKLEAVTKGQVVKTPVPTPKAPEPAAKAEAPPAVKSDEITAPAPKASEHAAKAYQELTIEVGKRVKINGLVNAPQYNGKEGKVKKVLHDEGRVVVVLNGPGDKELKIKKENVSISVKSDENAAAAGPKLNAAHAGPLDRKGLKGIKVVWLADFKEANTIPRSSDNTWKEVTGIEDVEKVFFIFVSHRWLSPYFPGGPYPGALWYRGVEEGHPDSEGCPKYKLLIEGVRRMQEARLIPEDAEVVLWTDYACIDQDGENPAVELNENMLSLISMSDMILTPVVDPGWRKWADAVEEAVLEGEGAADRLMYRADAWREYVDRAWCGLEMFYAANAPFAYELVAEKVGGKLQEFVLKHKARPHVVFGTREDKLGKLPILLEPLRDDVLDKNDPGNGKLTSEADRDLIRMHVKNLRTSNLVQRGLAGVRDAIAMYGFRKVRLVMQELAGIYEHQCRFSKQLEMHQRILDRELEELGDEHVDVATTHNGMGNVYVALGDYSKALGYYKKALDIRCKALGDEHVDVAATHNNMGNVYRTLGDYSKALEYQQKALDIRCKALGDEHVDVAKTHNNIGLVLEAQGKYDEALEMYNKSLQIKLKMLGSDHVDVAATHNNMGVVYRKLGDYSKALECFEKDLKISCKALGNDHVDVAATLYNMALVKETMGDVGGAVNDCTESYRICCNVLGVDHPRSKSRDEMIKRLQKAKSTP